MKRTLSIILLPISLWLSTGIINAVSANECPLFQDIEKLNQKDIIGNLNLSCMDQLHPVDYEKLVSMITSERNSKSIVRAASANQAEVYDQLIEKTLNKYAQDQNKSYENALLELLDSQKFAKLRDYFDYDCTSLNNKNKIIPKNREAILYMHSLTKNRFINLLIKKDGILSYNISDTGIITEKTKQLRSMIKSLRGQTEDQNIREYEKLKETSSFLYETILRSFESNLEESIDHLIIIPDAMTGIVPFDALWDKTKNMYVLEKNYSISYMPERSQTSNIIHKGKDILFVTPDLPEANTSFNLDLKPLERNFSQVKKLQGSGMTRSGLINALNSQPIDILYIATHAKFSQDFKESYIQLHNPNGLTNENISCEKDKTKLCVKDFERMIASSSARKKPPSLIVLSACESAQGGNGKPDASLGLAGVAARSGANSVIAGLWTINRPEVLLGSDNPTEGENEYFYRIITREPTTTKAKALQQSKKYLKNDRSIYDWAALVLIGDWGPMQ